MSVMLLAGNRSVTSQIQLRNKMKQIAVIIALAGLSNVAWAALNPSGRIDYAWSYYPPLKALVLHGGWGEQTQWAPQSDVWKLDATGWHELSTQNSPAFSHHSMTYDAARQLLVLSGQQGMGNGAHQVWEFDGSAWGQVL